MRARGQVVASLVAVSFCWILNRPQIVADGNHWKQDDNQHDQADERRPPVPIGAPPNSQPEADAGEGHHGPNGIEE